MVDRAVLLREVCPSSRIFPISLKSLQAIDKFLLDPQFRELHKYKLGDEDWKALEVFQRILAVSAISGPFYYLLTRYRYLMPFNKNSPQRRHPPWEMRFPHLKP